MKNLITGSASLILILALLLQFVYTETVFQRMRRIEDAEDDLRESIREEGAMTEEAKETFVRAAETAAGKKGVVTIREPEAGAPRTPRGGRVRLRIRVTVGKKILAASFWDVPERENELVWEEDGAVVSEYLPAEEAAAA